MVARLSGEQWSPASWPTSFRWRLLAAIVVLAATVTAILALSRDGDVAVEVPVAATAQWWPKGHPPGDHAIVHVPAGLAALFVHPSELEGTVAAIDVPEGTLVTAKMLRPRDGGDDSRTTALMRFNVSSELWPNPGPVAGSRAVFSLAPGGCAEAQVTLVAVDSDGASARVTVEAAPERAAVLADEQWWIWESPPGNWPQCERETIG